MRGTIRDEDGLELATLEKARDEAARSLADAARDELRSAPRETTWISIEVRTRSSVILKLKLVIEVEQTFIGVS